MRKKIAILIMALLLIAPVIQDVTATKTVFITTDNIVDHDFDVGLITAIKNYVQELSGGELQVVIDNQAPAAGEGYRSIEVTSDASIDLAASDAGNYIQLANYSAHSNKQIVFVNIGDYDLDNSSNYLRRAWDDNYTNETIAGVHDPGTLLRNSGIFYVQPAKEFPDKYRNGILDNYDDEMAKQIAQEIVGIINTHDNDTKVFSEDLVVKNKISPAGMANASKELLNSGDKEFNGTFGAYTAPQLLYQTSSYLNGNGLDIPKTFKEPENPMGVSIFAKGSYSISDYFKMGGIVRNYMDEHGQAPDSIEYEGAQISYYDLLYNFAKITQNHTDSAHMGFENEYQFEKVNSSFLLDVFPFILVLFILFLVYLVYKRIRR